MRPDDLAAVYAVQCAAYPAAYHEPVDALATHWQAAPACCFVAERGEAVCAYVFSHPWAGEPPILHQALPACAQPEFLFIHDLAVHPQAVGKGVAGRLMQAVRQAYVTLGLDGVRLVAVGEAASFWQRHGFIPTAATPVPACYGAAVLMASAA